MNIFFIGFQVMTWTVIFVLCAMFLKGATKKQKEQEDLEQELWIKEHGKNQ